jgi:hypothetical protein
MITERWCNNADKGNQVLGDKLVPVVLCVGVPHGMVRYCTAACEGALPDWTFSRPKHVCVCACVCV